MLISSAPTLQLSMVLPWGRPQTQPFPFSVPSARYYYLARNAIWALTKLWKLEGEEILFPSYFHGVEFETLTAAGVKLRFYPIHTGMRMDVGEVESLVTPNTRAIYLIHYLGFPGPARELARLCQARGIRLIEDCALALLSKDGERPLGSVGDAAIFCLYKTLPVPNGGALTVREPQVGNWPEARSPSFVSTMAYTATALQRHLRFSDDGLVHKGMQTARRLARANSDSLGIVPVGDNHFDPATADLAMSRPCHWMLQRQDYSGIVERRRRNYLQLLDRMKEISRPLFEGLPEGVCPLFYPLVTPNKMAMFEMLLERGIEAVNFWSQTPDSIAPGTFPEADELRSTILELPCHQDLTSAEISAIADQTCEIHEDLNRRAAHSLRD